MNATAILISADDAADLLSTTRRRVLRMVRERRIPFVDLGDGEPRFVREQLESWARQLRGEEVQGD